MQKQSVFYKALIVTISALSVFSLQSVVKAANEYWSGGFSSARELRHVPDDSVWGQYYRQYVKPAADAWNGISSRVEISSSLSGSYDIHSKIKNEPNVDVKGRMVSYCAQGSGYHACNSSTWTSAEVIGYDSAMDFDSYTPAEKLKVWTHEFGHALSLSHVTDGTIAVMAQGRSDIGVQRRDRQNLTAKWGN